MKASVVKITEAAKLRDTVGRNIIHVTKSGKIGGTLYAYQITVSQIAGLKRHVIILEDEDKQRYMLDFNIGKIDEVLFIDSTIEDNTEEEVGNDDK